MANILDYLNWRGDVPLALDGFNEVDNLLMAKLVHINFADIVPGPESVGGVALCDAAAAYFKRYGESGEDMGALVPPEIPELLRALAASRRFREIRLGGYEAILDEKKEEQFAAMCMELGDGTVYCAFRGTDDTLIGWKEDLNLGIMDTIPSQGQALSYLEGAAARYAARQLRVGGHSKGGNLAAYSAIYASEETQQRIVRVYNNDGPGFKSNVEETPGYRRVAGKIVSIVPQASVVGQMLERLPQPVVVHSTGSGIGQHNGFTWEVYGCEFVHLPDFSRGGKRTEETLDSIAEELSGAQREAFVKALYEVLTGTGARTLSDLNEEKLKSASGMLKTYRDLDDETRKALSSAMKLLVKFSAKSFVDEMRSSTDKSVEELRRRVEDAWRKLFE